jgi:hypothetical protein
LLGQDVVATEMTSERGSSKLQESSGVTGALLSSTSVLRHRQRMGRTKTRPGAWRAGSCTTSWMGIVGASGFGRHQLAASHLSMADPACARASRVGSEEHAHVEGRPTMILDGAETAPAADGRRQLHDFAGWRNVAPMMLDAAGQYTPLCFALSRHGTSLR